MSEDPAAVRRFDALISGGSLSALQTALDLAEVGLQVAVADGGEPGGALPEGAQSGDALSPAALPGSPSTRDPEGSLTAFIERIAAPIRPDAATAEGSPGASADAGQGLGAVRRIAPPATPMLRDRAGAWVPQPEPAVLGIPAVPLARESIALLGGGGAARAHLDRLMPLLTIGKTRSLGALVRRRVGRAVQERAVEPLVRERYGAAADEVDVAIAAPGLNEALSRAGSLTSAVSAFAERFDAWDASVEPAEGWPQFREAILARLRAFGVVLLHSPVVNVERIEAGAAAEGALLADSAEAAEAAEAADGPDVGEGKASRWRITLGAHDEVDGDVESDGDHGAAIEVRALVIDHPGALDAWPAWAEIGQIDVARPNTVRIHAEIGMSQPRADESLPADEASLVQNVGEWSVRIEVRGRTPHAILHSPRIGAADASPPETLIAAANEVLESTGFAAQPGAEWWIQCRAAPWITEYERNDAARILRDRVDQEPTMLPVGTALHGDDISAALRAAHEGAIALRRLLLGLAE